ncbi:hypothetical protein HK102_013998 [Quaeritorhiza haematococci]|nr:hypothetical protein HK102_013998 [Quaeritorhiza haematococci]
MFPLEICDEIGTWLSDYNDFANLAVALGIKWSPATQAQRMIRKYGAYCFLDHAADETVSTRTRRRYINFTNYQLRFYEYLVRRHPDVVAKEIELFETAFLNAFQQLEPLLKLGVRLSHAVSMESLEDALYHAPVVIELLLETGQLDCDEITASADFLPLHPTAVLGVGEQHILIRELLDRGANPNAVKSVLYTPAAMAMLLERSADPDAIGWGRKILKFRAADLWILDMWILDYGWLPVPAHRSDLSDPLNSLLEHAVYSGNVAAIKFILSHLPPSDINVYGVWLVFCMTWQWHTKQHEIVDLLLMHGCDPNDSYGYLLDKLLQRNEFALKLFALLIDHRADISAAMPSAIRNDDVRAIMRILVLSKPDILYLLQYAELRQAKKAFKFLRSIQMEQ